YKCVIIAAIRKAHFASLNQIKYLMNILIYIDITLNIRGVRLKFRRIYFNLDTTIDLRINNNSRLVLNNSP
ncbi:MAG: hypothetical protein ACXAAH_17455, partial [Promethearchaeota archaeon]